MFKHTYFLQQWSNGWTESWYCGVNLLMSSQIEIARNYANQRAKGLATEASIRYARITDLSVTPHPVWVETIGRAGVGVGAGIPSAADFADTSVMVRCYNAAQTRSKIVYVRGIPDSIINDGGEYQPTAAFNKFITDWSDFMRSQGMGWLGVNAPTLGNITAMVQNASGQVDVTSSANLFGATPAGTHVVLRMTGVLGPRNLNGQFTCVVTSGTTFTTLRRIAIFPYLGGGRVRYSSTNLIQVNTATGIRTVERKAGRPSFQSPGRRKARVLG